MGRTRDIGMSYCADIKERRDRYEYHECMNMKNEQIRRYTADSMLQYGTLVLLLPCYLAPFSKSCSFAMALISSGAALTQAPCLALLGKFFKHGA